MFHRIGNLNKLHVDIALYADTMHDNYISGSTLISTGTSWIQIGFTYMDKWHIAIYWHTYPLFIIRKRNKGTPILAPIVPPKIGIELW